MGALTVGANLTPINNPATRRFSVAFTELIRNLHRQSAKTMYCDSPETRVFEKVTTGAPTAIAANSPGQDLCLIYHTYAGTNDLYLVSGWSDADTFTVTKIHD